MPRITAIRFVLGAAAASAAVALVHWLPPARAESTEGGSVRVGVVSTLFRDVPEPMVPTLLRPLRSLLETQTGMVGNLAAVKTWEQLAADLEARKTQLGVFHGFEFAWAREKYPNLKPLVVTVGNKGLSCACLIVRNDSDADEIEDLKGATVAVPLRTREHCHLFLERQCASCQAQTMKEFFGEVTRPASVEAGFAAVIGGRVRALVTDGASLEWYRERRPTLFAKLKVIKKSDPFPPAVFAYRPGTVDEETVKRVQQGLYAAHENDDSRQIMAHCQIARFIQVPDDYDKTLAAFAKTYPAPAK